MLPTGHFSNGDQSRSCQPQTLVPGLYADNPGVSRVTRINSVKGTCELSLETVGAEIGVFRDKLTKDIRRSP